MNLFDLVQLYANSRNLSKLKQIKIERGNFFILYNFKESCDEIFILKELQDDFWNKFHSGNLNIILEFFFHNLCNSFKERLGDLRRIFAVVYKNFKAWEALKKAQIFGCLFLKITSLVKIWFFHLIVRI